MNYNINRCQKIGESPIFFHETDDFIISIMSNN